MHLEAFHFVEVDKLDWTRPVSSQVNYLHTYIAVHVLYTCTCFVRMFYTYVSTLTFFIQTLSYKKREPNFKCHCGTGFDFEDDLQVHQV